MSFCVSSGIFICALGRERLNLTIYKKICPIQDLLEGKALILWYVYLQMISKYIVKYASLKIIYLKNIKFLLFGYELVSLLVIY